MQTWWGKTKEMLTLLDEVIKQLPDVHFTGQVMDNTKIPILEKLEKHENFHYLGTLEYPDKV